MDETNRYASSIALPFDAEVKTAKGWNKIKSVNTTMKTSCIRLATKSTSLVCSRNHRIMDASEEFIFAEDCLGAFVQTAHGIEEVQKVEDAGSMQLLDLSLDGDHTYLTNAIVSHNCVAIDEAAFVPGLEDVLQSIGPTLTRDKNADLILATTPAGRNGLLYELYLKAKDDPDWHLQTTTVHDAIRMGLDVDLASLHTLCPDPDVFAQEYECVFQSEYGAWIDPESLVSEDVPETRSSQSWLGLDVGVKNDASGIAVAYESAGRLVFDFLGYLRKTSFEDQLNFIKQLQTSKSIAAGYVDAVGIGYGLSERIQKEVNWKIKPFNWTAANKTPAYEAFKADVLQKKVIFSSKFIDMAKDDIRLVKKIVTPDGHVKYSSDRTSLGHGDLASAIVLCHQAWRSMPAHMSMPQPVPMMSIF